MHLRRLSRASSWSRSRSLLVDLEDIACQDVVSILMVPVGTAHGHGRGARRRRTGAISKHSDLAALSASSGCRITRPERSFIPLGGTPTAQDAMANYRCGSYGCGSSPSPRRNLLLRPLTTAAVLLFQKGASLVPYPRGSPFPTCNINIKKTRPASPSGAWTPGPGWEATSERGLDLYGVDADRNASIASACSPRDARRCAAELSPQGPSSRGALVWELGS